MKRPARRGRASTLDEILPKVVGKLGHRGSPGQGAGALRVFKAFSRLGPPMTEQATPTDWRRGQLSLMVHSSPWLTELSFMREAMRRRINELLGGGMEVKRLRLQLGPGRARPEPVVVLPPLTEADRRQAERWADPIADPELRERFLRAAERSLQAKLRLPKGVRGPPGPLLAPAREPAKVVSGLTGFGPDRALNR